MIFSSPRFFCAAAVKASWQATTLPDRGYGATAFQRQPSRGSVTVNDLGDFDASATTFSVVPAKLKFVA